MRQIFQRLLAPLLLMTALPTSVSQADGIRLVGPTGEVQSSPSFSEQVERANAPCQAATNLPHFTVQRQRTKRSGLWPAN